MPAAEVVGDTAQAVAPLVDSSTEIIPILNQMAQDVQQIEHALAALLALFLVFTCLYMALRWFT